MLISLVGLRVYAQQAQSPKPTASPKPFRIGASGQGNRVAPVSGKAAASGVHRDDSPSSPQITLLGSVQTASVAESFALNGNLAYTCDDNEISVINIASPSSLQIVGTASASIIQNSGDIHCDVQRADLVVFSDQTSTTLGNSPGFVAFSLTNPNQPSVIAATPIEKRFFSQPLYLGTEAFVPTNAVGGNAGEYGDLLAIDVTNFSNPVLDGTLESGIDPVYGGPNTIIGVVQASGSLLYVGGSSSVALEDNGSGWLETVDATNPASMQVVGQILLPGTKQFSAP